MNARRLTAAAGVVAVVAGAIGLWLAGAPVAMAAANLVAALAGLALAWSLPEIGRRGHLALSIAAVAALALPLAPPGLDGVHRWVSVGPVALQPGVIAVPVLVVLLVRQPDWPTAVAVAAAALLLALQPDRATATALAVVAIALMTRSAPAAAAALAATFGAVATWLRADPLSPVRHVEGVVAAAWQSGGWTMLAVAIGAAAMLVPALATGPGRIGARAMALYWLALLAMSVIGPWPTPLLGFGVSGVIGWFAAAALIPGRNAGRD